MVEPNPDYFLCLAQEMNQTTLTTRLSSKQVTTERSKDAQHQRLLAVSLRIRCLALVSNIS
jgi:hypothetical protein